MSLPVEKKSNDRRVSGCIRSKGKLSVLEREANFQQGWILIDDFSDEASLKRLAFCVIFQRSPNFEAHIHYIDFVFKTSEFN